MKQEVPGGNRIVELIVCMVAATAVAVTLIGCAGDAEPKSSDSAGQPTEIEEFGEPQTRTIDFAEVERDIAGTVQAYVAQSSDNVDNYDSQYTGKIIGYCNGDIEYLKGLPGPEIQASLLHISTLAFYDIETDGRFSSFWTDMLKDSERVDKFNDEIFSVIDEADTTRDYSRMVAIAEEYMKQTAHNDPFKNVQMHLFAVYLFKNEATAELESVRKVLKVIDEADLSVSSSGDDGRTRACA